MLLLNPRNSRLDSAEKEKEATFYRLYNYQMKDIQMWYSSEYFWSPHCDILFTRKVTVYWHYWQCIVGNFILSYCHVLSWTKTLIFFCFPWKLLHLMWKNYAKRKVFFSNDSRMLMVCYHLGLKYKKVWWNIAILLNLLFVAAQQEEQHERKQ